MQKQCAGLLLFRRQPRLEVLLGWPGLPYPGGKIWQIPKGKTKEKEPLLAAARREWTEETGQSIATEIFLALGSVTQGDKDVFIWAFEGDCDTTKPFASRVVSIKWPANSNSLSLFRELDRIQFFSLEAAYRAIVPAQIPFLTALETKLKETQ